MNTDEFDEPQTRGADVQELVRGIARELDAASYAYGDVYSQMAGAGELDDATREAAIRAVANVATMLRRMAPSLSTLDALPNSDQARLAVVLLRLLTDSLSVALADTPDRQLMAAPSDIVEVIQDVQAALDDGTANQ